MSGNNALARGIIDAYGAGRDNRDRTTRQNALGAYSTADTPEAQQNALRPLVGLGDFETLEAARGHQERNAFDRTRRDAGAAAGAGRYGEAANLAAGAGQVDLAQQFMQLDRGALEAAKTRGERGAAAIYSAIQLPPPQRAAYIAQHQGLAAELGITPEQLQAVDFTNDTAMRALADQWQDASKLAGDISLQRFGDSVQTVRTGPSGTDVLDSREVPQTRAETFERQQFGYRQDQDSIDNQYRDSRAQAEDAYRQWQMQNSVSRSDIEGQVLQRAIQGGVEALTPEEKAVYDRAVSTSQGGFLGQMTSAPPAAAAATASPPPRQQAQSAGGSPGAGNPARPQTEADYAALPPGALFIDPDDGQLYRK